MSSQTPRNQPIINSSWWTPSSSWKVQRRQWFMLGPTTAHLSHEFYLWIALVFLQISWLHNLYGSPFSSSPPPPPSSTSSSTSRSTFSKAITSSFQRLFGRFTEEINSSENDDIDSMPWYHSGGIFLLLSTIWLSRYLVTRWILTSGVTIQSSNRNPTFLGVIAHWISSHIIAGQVIDRPPNPAIASKQIGTQYNGYGSTADEFDAVTASVGAGGTGGSSGRGHQRGSKGVGGVWTMVWLRRFIPPSIAFTWQYMKIWLWYPLLSFKERVMGFQQPRKIPEGETITRSEATVSNTPSGSHDGKHKGRRRQQQHHQSQRGGSSSSSSASSSSLGPSTSFMTSPPHPASRYIFMQINRFWRQYGPSLQMLIPVTTFVFLIWYILQEDELWSLLSPATSTPSPSSSTFVTGGTGKDKYRHRQALTMLITGGSNPPPKQDNGMGEPQPFGSYQRLDPPTLTSVIYYLCALSIAYSIILYGRIILPMPDFVIGESSMLKAIRNEAKASYSGHHQHGSASSSSSSSSSFSFTNFFGGFFGTGGSSGRAGNRSQRDKLDTPWLERYVSIADQNRFRLISKVAFARLIENLWVCLIFPRTALVCRFAGHCPTTVTTMDLSKILYHVGVKSPLREDVGIDDQFGFGSRDLGAAILTSASVIVITCSLLLAQAAVLNRSYLAIMGYLTGEWVIVDENDPALAGNVRISPWDPKRRYKKGDLISWEPPSTSSSGSHGTKVVYRAHSNSPEGKPFDLYLRATHDVFRSELGHPSSSHLIAFLSTIQFVLISVVILMILVYVLILGSPTGSLLWTLAANLVADYGMMIAGTPKYDEISHLADEINAQNKDRTRER